MKKIYLVLSACAITLGINAQTITKAANEPVVGDYNFQKQHDSVGVVPKNTGAGMNWNFGAFTINTNTAASSYSATSSSTASSLFPGATIVENKSSGDKNFWKSAATPTTQYELHGIYNPAGVEFNMSADPAIFVIWPVAMGGTQTDVGTGTVSAFSQTGTVSSTVTTNGSGTGTLVAPGNVTFTNVLQVKTTQTLTALVGTGFGTISINVLGTTYGYYNSLQKFPLLEVQYEKTTQTSALGPTITTTAKIFVNNNIITTGINEVNFSSDFVMFPNPAKDNFSVNLTNAANDNGSIEIYNELGQVAKRIDLGSESVIKTNVSVSDLKPGVYFVKTNIGNRTSSRKLIIE